MIIERRAVAFPAKAAVVALSAWFGGMAALAALFDPSAVIVFAPPGLPASIIAEADGALLTSGVIAATGTSDRSGFVRRLYGRGAWFVWPALGQGCFAPGRFTR